MSIGWCTWHLNGLDCIGSNPIANGSRRERDCRPGRPPQCPRLAREEFSGHSPRCPPLPREQCTGQNRPNVLLSREEFSGQNSRPHSPDLVRHMKCCDRDGSELSHMALPNSASGTLVVECQCGHRAESEQISGWRSSGGLPHLVPCRDRRDAPWKSWRKDFADLPRAGGSLPELVNYGRLSNS